MKNVPEENQQKVELIKKVILSFYTKVTADFLLGYHFRKIKDPMVESKDPLRPPIEAFKHHLPHIYDFWSRQLISQVLDPNKRFDLINVHGYLKLNRGELERFCMLFKEEIESFQDELKKENLYKVWLEKLDHFTKVFMDSYFAAPTQA